MRRNNQKIGKHFNKKKDTVIVAVNQCNLQIITNDILVIETLWYKKNKID